MRLAVCQLLVEGGEPQRNLDRALHYINRAASNKSELVLLPETLDFGWTHPSSLNEACDFPSSHVKLLQDSAKKNTIDIVAGLTERINGELYNVAVYIDQGGNILGLYKKINLLEVEFPYYSIGDELKVINTRFGKVGLNICSDNYLTSLHLGHSLAHMGADIILSPSAWTVDYSLTEDDDVYGDKWIAPMNALSAIHKITVASATSVGYIVGGPYEGKKMVGASLVYQNGNILGKGITNELSSHLDLFEIYLQSSPYRGTQVGDQIASFRNC